MCTAGQRLRQGNRSRPNHVAARIHQFQEQRIGIDPPCHPGYRDKSTAKFLVGVGQPQDERFQQVSRRVNIILANSNQDQVLGGQAGGPARRINRINHQAGKFRRTCNGESHFRLDQHRKTGFHIKLQRLAGKVGTILAN